MEVAENKKLNVPKLRFREFENQWELSEIGEFVAERKEIAESDIPLYSLTIQNGVVPKSKRYERSFLVKGESSDAYKAMVLGDFAFNPMNLRFGALAMHKEDKRVAVSKYYDIFYGNEKVNSMYLESYLTTYNMIQYYNKMSTGTLEEKKRVHYLDFIHFKKPFPTLPEQKKIADFLSAVDEKLQQLNRKKELLEKYKKGVMQKLFSQELRFKHAEGTAYADWEEKRLGDGIELLSGFAFKGDAISENVDGVPLLRGINITEGHIRHSIEIDRYYSGKLEGLEKYAIAENDLVIGMDGSKVGKNAALVTTCDQGALLIQRVARLRAKKGFDIRFAYQHIRSSRFIAYVDMVNTSSGIPHISARQIKDFEIGFPCQEEQQNIADFLSSLDKKIAGVSAQIEKTQQFKKGLLQEMFV
jgi:type I restriction enzyme S subunit